MRRHTAGSMSWSRTLNWSTPAPSRRPGAPGSARSSVAGDGRRAELRCKLRVVRFPPREPAAEVEQREVAREDFRLDTIRLAVLDVSQPVLRNPELVRRRLDREATTLARLSAARGDGMEPDAVARVDPVSGEHLCRSGREVLDHPPRQLLDLGVGRELPGSRPLPHVGCLHAQSNAWASRRAVERHYREET